LTKVSNDGRYRWNGVNDLVYNGYHLGIFDSMHKDKKGDVATYCPGPGQGKTGWGFGNRSYTDDVQGYVWAGKPIDKAVFAIAIKAGPLTAAESARLLNK